MPERYDDTYNPFWESVGFNNFLCIGTEQLRKKIGIILFVAENVPFKIPCNYSATLVDIDHCEVLSCIINLFPPNKSPLLAFPSLKRLLLAQSLLGLGLPTLVGISEG